MLRTQGLTRRFGGLVAVDHVDFELGADELCSLIGPNGAGKTTFFNLLTGVLSPSEGAVELRADGEYRDITDADPAETARRGVHRSYQITNIFPQNTVLENVRVAVQAGGTTGRHLHRNVHAYDDHFEDAYSVLERVDLTEEADTTAANLSHGAARQLEVGVALAGDPDVLLLDEPNAGVSSESVDDVIALIEDVATDHAVLLVEHNMDIVMNVSDRVVVLDRGSVIADGAPEDVRNDEDVRQAYLGGYEREAEPGDANGGGVA